ncbi:MAG: GGDEF domain-containing protein [Pseudomonadota bacterium]
MSTAFSLQQSLLAVMLSLAGLGYAASFQRYRFALGWLILLWLALGLGAGPLSTGLNFGIEHDVVQVVNGWLPWNLLALALLPRIPLFSRAIVAILVLLALQQVIPLMIDADDLARRLTLNQWLVSWLPAGAHPYLLPLEPKLLTVACLAFFVRWQKSHSSSELFLFLLSCAMLMASLRPALIYPCFLAACACMMLGVLLASHDMAFVDPLTRLKNRRALDNAMKTLSGNFAIAMLDIDHFKKVNDRFGHDFGDQVLRMVAARVRRLRLCQPYRYGGEEFCLVFRGRSLVEAKKRCEKIREEISSRPVAMRGVGRPQRKPLKKSAYRQKVPSVKATVSIGLAHSSKHAGDAQTVVAAADKALYRAKKGGRNRVEVSR